MNNLYNIQKVARCILIHFNKVDSIAKSIEAIIEFWWKMYISFPQALINFIQFLVQFFMGSSLPKIKKSKANTIQNFGQTFIQNRVQYFWYYAE